MIPAGTFLGLTKIKIDEEIGLMDKTGKFI
jgi:hypothetical protein